MEYIPLLITCVIIVILLWLLNSQSPNLNDGLTEVEKGLQSQSEELMVLNYHKKPSYSKKVVIVIESFQDLKCLTTLIKNILNQCIKVHSIILISENSSLKKVPLLHNTCIFNKIGGKTMLVKESGNDTIIIFVFSGGDKAFYEPHFIEQFVTKEIKINGLFKVETSKAKIDISQVYN